MTSTGSDIRNTEVTCISTSEVFRSDEAHMTGQLQFRFYFRTQYEKVFQLKTFSI